jgi:hypothetical protein
MCKKRNQIECKFWRKLFIPIVIFLFITSSKITYSNDSKMLIYSTNKNQSDHIIVNTLQPGKVFSNDIDPQLLCFVASSFYEKKYNMPRHILHSISIVESGRLNKNHKISLAWPWVIGIDGKGNFFDTYAEAAKFLRKAIATGENVDIGCHQVNWKYHGHNFKNPEELLHPKHNAAYAAYFLTQHFNETKNWEKAIAYYHSRTPELGGVYLKKVQSIWNGMKGAKGKEYYEYVKVKSAEVRKIHQYTSYYKPHNIYKNKNIITTATKKNIMRNSNNFKYGKKSDNDIVVFSEKALLPINTSLAQP